MSKFNSDGPMGSYLSFLAELDREPLFGPSIQFADVAQPPRAANDNGRTVTLRWMPRFGISHAEVEVFGSLLREAEIVDGGRFGDGFS